MSKRTRYARVAITLPQEVLEAADQRAAELDRPRSWVIAEAIAAYTANRAVPAGRDDVVRGSGEDPLGSSRLAQLAADLRLTPEERVIAAEETARLTSRNRGQVQRVIGFDRYEDYLEFKRRDELAW